MKILEEIKRDHDQVRELFLQIENKEKEGPEIFKLLVAVLMAHRDAEEEMVFTALPDKKDAQELRRELLAEHDTIRRELQVVLDTDPKDENWKARLEVCKEVFTHHIQEEEKELFELFREELSESQMDKVYDKFTAAETAKRLEFKEKAEKRMILRPEDRLPREDDKNKADKKSKSSRNNSGKGK